MRNAIFITGAGSGIGRATAELFAKRGWFVGLADVNQAGIEETARLIGPENASLHPMDVRDRAQWRRALDAFVKPSGGRLDVLFNNAGVGHGGPFELMDEDKRELVIDVNLKGVIYGAEAALPHLIATPGSCLLNTCSAAGLYAGPRMSVYAASKFGVRALTDSLDAEWEDKCNNVRTKITSIKDTPQQHKVAPRTNQNGREQVNANGLEFTPVEQVAEAAWNAVHGKKRHVIVGKTAKRLAFILRWAPGLVARMRPKRVE
jgi:NADP-dependent 3-hydroxy acid dehydrogenase YdfG